MVGPSLPLLLSLPDRCGRIDRSGGGADLWCVRCARCGCIHYLIWDRQSYHVDESGKRVDVCNCGPQGIPPSRVIVVAAAVVVGVAAATAVAAVGGGGLLGEDGEHRKIAAPKEALHACAEPNQRCKTSDSLDGK